MREICTSGSVGAPLGDQRGYPTADIEPTRRATQHLAHDAVVLAKGPSSPSPAAREDHVHRASRADGTLELAAAGSYVPAVCRSRQLGLHLTAKKRQLHRMNLMMIAVRAMSFR
jgi:hypothetical protein